MTSSDFLRSRYLLVVSQSVGRCEREGVDKNSHAAVRLLEYTCVNISAPAHCYTFTFSDKIIFSHEAEGTVYLMKTHCFPRNSLDI